jgi:hypothetical protein
MIYESNTVPKELTANPPHGMSFDRSAENTVNLALECDETFEWRDGEVNLCL